VDAHLKMFLMLRPQEWFAFAGRRVVAVTSEARSLLLSPRVALCLSVSAASVVWLFVARPQLHPAVLFGPVLLLAALWETGLHRRVPLLSQRLSGLNSHFPLVQDTLLLLVPIVLNFSTLFSYWAVGRGNPVFSIGGYLPYCDAMAYYDGALRIIETGAMDAWNTMRRPLGVGFLSVVLKASGQSLLVTHFVNTLLVSVATGIAAKAVARYWGFTAGLLMVLCLFSFGKDFIGTFMTENIGLVFGAVACSLILGGVRIGSVKRFFFGLLVLGLALEIRAGAYLALVLLAAWAGWVFRTRRTYATRVLIAGLAVVAAVMLVSPLMVQTIGDPSVRHGLQKTNISYSLYGIARGGKGWETAFVEHPEISTVSEAERSKAIYSYALGEIREHPEVFAGTVLGVLAKGMTNPFGFFSQFPFPFDSGVLFLPFVVAIIGAFRTRERRERYVLVTLLVAGLGAILTSPILVDGGYRTYAATAALHYALFCAGVGLLIRATKQWFSGAGDGAQFPIVAAVEPGCAPTCSVALPTPTQVHEELPQSGASCPSHEQASVATAFGVILIAVLTVGPLLVKMTSSRVAGTPQSASVGCPGDSACVLVIRCPTDSYVNIVDDSSAAFVPRLRIGSYLRHRQILVGNPVFERATAGQYLVGTFDQGSGFFVYILFNEDISKLPGGYVRVCATRLGGRDGHDLYQARWTQNIDDLSELRDAK